MSNQHSPAIDAVIFDFGNVICTFDLDLLVRRLAGPGSVRVSRVAAGLRASIPIVVEYETGLISTDTFYRRLCESTGITLKPDDFRSAYCGIFAPVPVVWQLIHSLKSRYTLGLLSNTNELHDACAIRPTSLFPLFDAVTLSYIVHAMKPAEEIYRDMLSKLALPASRCVYVDDLQDNVDAAARLGMFAIRFRDSETLLTDLAGLGIRWPPFPHVQEIGL